MLDEDGSNRALRFALTSVHGRLRHGRFDPQLAPAQQREREQRLTAAPPVAGGPAAIPVENALGSLKALTGSAGAPAQGDAIVAAESSASESGLTPSAPATGARTLQVQRRSLEAR